MKRPSPYKDRKTNQIAMTPMIDVVFLLLVFFLWTASFQVVEYSLPSSVSPPVAAGSQAQQPLEAEDFEQVIVRITSQPAGVQFSVNQRQAASLVEVRTVLQTLASIRADVPLVIDPDPEVPVGTVVDVYDLGRLLNYQEIQFAVERP